MKHVSRLGVMAVPGQNRGDDAIAMCLIEGFRKQRPDLHFVVPVLKQGIFSDDPLVKTFILSRRSPLGLLRLAHAIYSVDAVVVGAGSVIQDKLGGGYIRGMLGYGWTVSLLCSIFRKPTLTSPIGIDELSSGKSKRIAKQFLERVGKIFVRDPLSNKVGREILGTNSSIEITTVCDAAFYWSGDNIVLPSQREYYALSPAFEGQDEAKIVALFKEIIVKLAADTNANFCLISMVDRDDEDAGKLCLIQEELSPNIRARTFIAKPKTAMEARGILCSSRAVIAMRLHALILGYGATSLYCISRTTKTDGLMHTYNIPGIRLSEVKDIEAAAQTACDVLQNDDGMKSSHQEMAVLLKAKLDEYYKSALAFLDAAMAR